jgi:hypothetical protein
VSRPPWLNKLALASGAALTAVLLGEAALRLAGRPPASFLYTGPFRDRQAAWDVTYGVDGRGRRVTAARPPRAARPRRLAVLGDSFAFGQGVPDYQDFVSRVNARGGAWQLDNLGLIGAGVHEYQLVARDLVDRNYDGALVLFYGNDVSQVVPRRSLLGHLAARSSVFALLQRAYRSSVVASRRREPAESNLLSSLRDDPGYLLRIAEPDAAAQAAFAEQFAVLLARLHAGLGPGRVLVAMVPEGTLVSPRLRRFVIEHGGAVAPFGRPGGSYQLLRDLARRDGATFIETFPTFLAAGDRAYHAEDLHWTADGHQVMASLTEAALAIR